MKIYKESANCYGCTACMNACPICAIVMVEDDEGFLYPNIDEVKCVNCGICKNICKKHNDFCYETKKEPSIYAAININPECRKNSSSGGLFSAMAEYVLNQKGTVYGAAFNEQFMVKHIKISSKNELNKLKGSKYVQSNMGTIFTDVKNDLTNGLMVLFSGTPCQVNGLKAYLNSPYDNLFLCDIVCHGVPSPLIWKDYIDYISEKYGNKPIAISFRDKKYGWRKQAININFGRTNYIKTTTQDPFYIMYFAHYMLRPSCHNCNYASYYRCSDITLGDFWGIEKSKIGKQLDDDKGVSLVMANTEKGNELVAQIKKQIDIIESNQDECFQVIFKAPSKRSPLRDVFWK